jgi:hypothetical protein
MKDEIPAKITETLRGKTVKAVYYSRYIGNVEEDTPTSLEVNEGDIRGQDSYRDKRIQTLPNQRGAE